MMRFRGTISPAKIFAFCILVVGAIALFRDAQAVTYLSILAGAGLYGWRKTEQRKIINNNKH